MSGLGERVGEIQGRVQALLRKGPGEPANVVDRLSRRYDHEEVRLAIVLLLKDGRVRFDGDSLLVPG